MRNHIIFSLLASTLLGGVASAAPRQEDTRAVAGRLEAFIGKHFAVDKLSKPAQVVAGLTPIDAQVALDDSPATVPVRQRGGMTYVGVYKGQVGFGVVNGQPRVTYREANGGFAISDQLRREANGGTYAMRRYTNDGRTFMHSVREAANGRGMEYHRGADGKASIRRY